MVIEFTFVYVTFKKWNIETENSNDYLSYCNYYKGEKQNPYKESQAENGLWFYEMQWVEAMLFNRYARTAYDIEGAAERFKEFYAKYYSN